MKGLILVLMLLIAVPCFGEESISSTVISDPAVTKDVFPDNAYIKFINESVDIRTINVYKDAAGNEVRRETGKTYIFINAPEDVENGVPENTDYTDFMTDLELTKSKLRTAVKNRL